MECENFKDRNKLLWEFRSCGKEGRKERRKEVISEYWEKNLRIGITCYKSSEVVGRKEGRDREGASVKATIVHILKIGINLF
jgi:hypothetical protein